MFSITIENCKKDFYFSEKLIDCFITGTIPIYWGCPSIGNFFNEKGIIVFNNIDDLKDILKDIDKKYYDERKKYILENYEISKNYLVADDIIFEKLTYGK
jgi:thermostable 8-oxoguanine DNA glycosylase